MDQKETSLFARAMAEVERFSEKNVAILPEKPCKEMLSHLAAVTGEDVDKLRRLYDLFIASARLDKYTSETLSGQIGFAEEADPLL